MAITHEMTDRLYENDSYLKEFTAVVTDCVPAAQVCRAWIQPVQLQEQEKNLIRQSQALKKDSQIPVQPNERKREKEPVTDQDPCRGYWAIALDRTAFFPEGGGQGADTGTLWIDPVGEPAGISGSETDASNRETEAFPVYDVQIVDGVIYHRTDLQADAGTRMQGRIDWKLRFFNMQQHSGEHIFSGLVHRYFGYDNVGFHLGHQAVTMDFNGPLPQEEINRIEWEANEAISKNVSITVSYPAEEELKTIAYRSKKEIEGQMRLVTVEGYDVCACCAPHVNRTGEIGFLKVVDAIKYKGGVRISILCGFRALEDYRKKQEQVQQVSRLLSAPADGIAEACAHRQEETAVYRQKIYELTQKLIGMKVAAISAGTQDAWFFEEDMNQASMRSTVNLAVRKVDRYAGIFCGNDQEGYQYIIAAKPMEDIEKGKGKRKDKDRGKEKEKEIEKGKKPEKEKMEASARYPAGLLRDAFSARGGGSPEMVQGFVKASKVEIEEVLSQMQQTGSDVGNDLR